MRSRNLMMWSLLITCAGGCSSDNAPPSVPTGISWVSYIQDCGSAAQSSNKVRSEDVYRRNYKGKCIRWSGQIVSISSKILGSGASIRVLMKPSYSPFSDVSLGVPKNITVTSLNKGDSIEYIGTINVQGGPFANHQIQVEQLRLIR